MILPLFYLFLIALAEILTATISGGVNIVTWGLILHGLLLVILLLHGASTRQTQLRRFLLTLALAPLIRILSISLPLQKLPLIDWYLIIGALLYVAAFFAAQFMGFSRQRMGLTFKDWPLQLGIALIGFGLGFMEFTILGPRPLIPSLSWGTLLYPAFVLMVFTGFLEEVIFRGLVQDVSTSLLGKFGIWYGALLFAVLHIGYLNAFDVVFVFGVGLLFGFIVQRTRSLLGVSLAHGFTNISMYLNFPFILVGGFFSSSSGQPPQELLVILPTVPPSVQQTPDLILFVTATPGPQGVQPTQPATLAAGLTLTPTGVASLTPARTAAPTLTCGVPSGWVVYTVRPGDTLSAISFMFRISLSALQNANCLTGTVIHPGQRLYVPFVPTSTPARVPATPIPAATASSSPLPDTATPIPTATPLIPTDTTLPPADTDTPLPPSPTQPGGSTSSSGP